MAFRKILGRGFSSLSAMAKANPIQEASMNENCILVNERDESLGYASKKNCHLVSPDGNLLLHRAFSLFLFNTKHELLLQRRSDTKLTFPGVYTNSCCSHPLFDIEEERQEINALGVKLAIRRRLNHELGIPKECIQLNDLKYLTRVTYSLKADDGIWGEKELDYIVFMIKDVPLKRNEDEVGELSYVGKDEINDFISNLKVPLSPWFKLILNFRLRTWWDNLDRLNDFQDHTNIHKLM